MNLDIVAAVKPNNSDIIKIKSDGYDMICIDLKNSLSKTNKKKVLLFSCKRNCCLFYKIRLQIKGFNAFMTSNVLKGSGLSSSAAF